MPVQVSDQMWNFKLEQQQPGNVNQTEKKREKNSASDQCPCIVCFLIAMFLKCMFWGLLLEVPPKCFCTMHCNVQIIFIVWFMSACWPGWHWWGWCSLAEIYLIGSAARRNIDVSLFDQNFLLQILTTTKTTTNPLMITWTKIPCRSFVGEIGFSGTNS